MTDLVIENGDLLVCVGSLTEVCFLVYMKSLQLETLFSDMLRHAACQVCVCFVSQLTGVVCLFQSHLRPRTAGLQESV